MILLANGALGEAATLKELIKQGYTVFTQFDGQSPFDLVAYKDGLLQRISVKSTKSDNNGSWQVELRQKGYGRTRLFDKSSCDILAVYIIPEDRVLLFDVSTLTNNRSLNIRKMAT